MSRFFPHGVHCGAAAFLCLVAVVPVPSARGDETGDLPVPARPAPKAAGRIADEPGAGLFSGLATELTPGLRSALLDWHGAALLARTWIREGSSRDPGFVATLDRRLRSCREALGEFDGRIAPSLRDRLREAGRDIIPGWGEGERGSSPAGEGMPGVSADRSAVLDALRAWATGPAQREAPGSAAVPSAGDGGAMAARLNGERAVVGLPPLRSDAHLAAVSAAHARELAVRGGLDHQSAVADLRTPRLRARAGGFHGEWLGENLYRGRGAADGVLRAWTLSDGHRKVLYHPSAALVGVGREGGFWVLNVGRERRLTPTG